MGVDTLLEPIGMTVKPEPVSRQAEQGEQAGEPGIYLEIEIVIRAAENETRERPSGGPSHGQNTSVIQAECLIHPLQALRQVSISAQCHKGDACLGETLLQGAQQRRRLKNAAHTDQFANHNLTSRRRLNGVIAPENLSQQGYQGI
jgi:hypothetical protein